MKFSTSNPITALTLCAALMMPIGVVAQYNEAQHHKPRHHTYKLVDLGTLGGPTSTIQGPLAQVLNNQGTVVGGADTTSKDPSNPCFNPFADTDCFIEHAFMWHEGVLKDLGTLPGGLFSFPLWINDVGLIAGSSENGVVDPLTNAPETRAVVWRNREIFDLGTLGGNQSGAIDINNRGEVIGFALNTVADDIPLTEVVGAGLAATQTRAFLWREGKMRDLGTLGGPDAFAQFINDRGQVAGFSYTSSASTPSTGIPPVHSFLWEDGVMTDLGTLGGNFSLVDSLNNHGQVVGPMNIAGDLTFHPYLWDRQKLKDLGTLGGDNGEAFWINDAGEVVGDADLPGSGTQLHHAFFWKHGRMMDLGTVSGDPCSVALFINSKSQVGGSSTDCSEFRHAFLWEHGGAAVDLNLLLQPSSTLRVREADDINDLGEIAGKAVLPNGDIHAVLLVPNGICGDRCEARVIAALPESSLTPQVTSTNVKLPRENAVGHIIRYRASSHERKNETLK